MSNRRCGNCGKVKPLTAYAKNHARTDGVQYWCKDCQADWRRSHFWINGKQTHRDDAQSIRSAVCFICGEPSKPRLSTNQSTGDLLPLIEILCTRCANGSRAFFGHEAKAAEHLTHKAEKEADNGIREKRS